MSLLCVLLGVMVRQPDDVFVPPLPLPLGEGAT